MAFIILGLKGLTFWRGPEDSLGCLRALEGWDFCKGHGNGDAARTCSTGTMPLKFCLLLMVGLQNSLRAVTHHRMTGPKMGRTDFSGLPMSLSQNPFRLPGLSITTIRALAIP